MFKEKKKTIFDDECIRLHFEGDLGQGATINATVYNSTDATKTGLAAENGLVSVLVPYLTNGCSPVAVPPGEVGPTQGCVRTELRVENFLVTMLDVGGALEDRETWTAHYGEAHGIIFVVDSSDRARLKEVKEEMVDILRQPRVAGKPFLV